MSKTDLSVALVVALVCLSRSATLAGSAGLGAQVQPPSPQQAIESGRVVATITGLEGTVRIAGVDVELRALDGNVVLAKTMTDGAGRVAFPDVPAGRYIIKATRPGFVPTDSTPFDVRTGAIAQVLLDINLTFVAPGVEVRAPTAATQSVQPVSTSDMLAGSVLDLAPLDGDDFQSLLPLLPGVLRGPDGRLRAKGGQPTQGALQISSTSLIDPSSGDFDLELPGQSLESVELLANPFAAEYGRFSTSVVQLRTRRGTNDWKWEPGNLIPRFRKGFRSVRGFEPRFSVHGPLRRDRLFLAQDFQFRSVKDPVKSLPDEPEIALTSFDSFTRVDSVLSPRHTLGGLVVLFPREIEHLTMNTFRPPEVTPEFNQSGTSVGVQDRFALSPTMVLESTLAGRRFEINVNTDGRQPMIYTPETQQGSFFNDQEREVRSVQWVEALSLSVDKWRGQHLFKFGLDFQSSRYEGSSESRPIDIRRSEGSLAERIVPGSATTQDVTAAELALFAQDQWRIGPRVTLELGLRMDREDVVERVNWSPRGGVSVAVLPEGRGILRGGVGKFRQRTPLNVGAFEQFEPRVVTRFAPNGEPLGPPASLVNVAAPDLRTPEAVTGNIEWNQRFGRRVLFKANYLKREGSHEYILEPQAAPGEIRLMSTGTSRYWELELTGRYLRGERRDLTVSYVRSHGDADLNNYDQFYGNLRNPILRANEHNLIPTDVPHRLLVRGTIGLPGQWDIAPVIEVRSGFPWSAVDEFQSFVGPRNRAGRLPRVHTIDFSLSRPWHVWKYRFRGGVKIYNLLGASAQRDVQSNVTSPAFGRFFNPLERSIGFVLGSAK
ncbi:MAG TPA: TonB-dependent receptor [Vicinamibacterales bacterium]|nr:TonB-dependent receptor [Vicinamibacterales bacterium]